MPAARLLLHERVVVDETAFVEIKIWRVPNSVRGSEYPLKYGLALVANAICVLRYDNEAGKGDHRHTADGRELSHSFQDAETLVADFWKDVDEWTAGQSGETT